MSDNLRQTVHSHHNHTPLCKAGVLDELLCIQISTNKKNGYIFFFSGVVKNFHTCMYQALCLGVNESGRQVGNFNLALTHDH